MKNVADATIHCDRVPRRTNAEGVDMTAREAVKQLPSFQDATLGWWSDARSCYIQLSTPQPPATAPAWASSTT